MREHLYKVSFWAFCLLISWGAGAQEVVAYYDFNGNSRDQSVNNNHAQVKGAFLTHDRFEWARRAFHFDGIQSAITAPNNGALNTDYQTVSFWVRLGELPAQGEVFLMSFGGWQERWKISLPAHGKPVWTTNNSSGISDMDSGDGNVLQAGEWTHLTFVHNGTNDEIYFNGQLAASKAVSGTMNNTSNPLGIGYDPIGGALYFNGEIDEVLILGEALNATQIAALYATQNTAPVLTNALVANYKMDGDSKDASVSGNHAFNFGAVLTTDRFGFGNSAYYFNGTDALLTAEPTAPLNSENLTVSFWINVRELPAQGEAFVISHGGWQSRFKISLPAHGKLVFTTNHTNGISDMDAGDAGALTPNTWKHVVMVHDGLKNIIYMDGVVVATKDVVGQLNSTFFPLGMGFNPIDGGNYFNGSLDEVQFYNYALSASEIADLHGVQSADPSGNPDLVADYKFAGNANDHSVYENHATGDASPGMDRFGYAANAMHFDGTSSLIAANSPALNSPATSISFWARVNELPVNGEAYLLSNGGWQSRWKISLPPHGKPVFTTNHANGISDMDSGDGNVLSPGEWKHLVFVHDGTDDKIYMNGVQVATKAVPGDLNNTSHPLGFGYNPIDGGNYFDGDLDEVQLYSRALSAAEILDLYNEQNETPVFTEELVAEYTFTGNTNDGTVFNNHATSSNALLTKDRFDAANHAMSFNGVDSKVTAGNSPQLQSDYATVSFWVNLRELPAQGEYFLLSHGGWQERWKISLPAHGKPVWTTNHSGGISDMDSGDGNVLTPGEWTHVVMVHDTDQDRIYFDGVRVAEKNVGGTLNSTTRNFGIGYNPIDEGNFTNGLIDDVQVYNVALTDAEIAALHAEQSQAPNQVDTEAPDSPLDLTADVVFTTVTLSWLASDDNVGVTGYNIYQDGTHIATVQNTNVVLTDLTPLAEILFGVSAVDAAGNESAISTLLVKVGDDESPDTTPPTKPGNLRADVGSYSVLLTWDPSVDDRIVAGYVALVDGVISDTLAGTATSVFIGGLEPEVLYTFEVYAFDAAGNNSEIADLTVATAPEIVTSEPGLVAWYPFEDNANDATPYFNHGVIGGDPTFQNVTDRPNASGRNIVFNGADSVLVPNAVQLISDYASIGFWVRVDDINIADAESYIMTFGSWSERWKISLPQHLKPVFTTNSKNAQFTNFISDMDSGDGNEVSQGFWWYVTMVHDGEFDIIYVDGVEANRKPVLGTLNSTGRPLGIGNNAIDGGQYFLGALDEIKIYNKALSSDEISSLYTNGTTGTNEYVAEELKGTLKNVFPNPATNVVNLEHSLPLNEELLIRVFDQRGRQVDAIRLAVGTIPAEIIQVDVNNYAQGLYFMNCISGGKNAGSLTFIKK
jgi:chitodextrinase